VKRIIIYAFRFEGGELYVGMTGDLTRRLQEHRRRQSPSTKRLAGDFEVIYTKVFESYAEARKHEKFLKSGAGRKLLMAGPKIGLAIEADFRNVFEPDRKRA